MQNRRLDRTNGHTEADLLGDNHRDADVYNASEMIRDDL